MIIQTYDIIIVGAGPAGLATSGVLSNKKNLKVLIIDKGKETEKRRDLINGWFGRALFGMYRTQLFDDALKNDNALEETKSIVKNITNYKNFESKSKFIEPPNNLAPVIAKYFQSKLNGKVNILFNTEVIDIEKSDKIIVKTSKGNYTASKLIMATGKHSTIWLNEICRTNNIKFTVPKPKIGVRIELPTALINKKVDFNEQTNISEDITVEDVCRNSFVAEWEEGGILSALGCNFPNKKTDRTTVMLGFTPENTSIEEIVKSIKIINILSNDKVKKERIQDYISNRSVLKHVKLFDGIHKSIEDLNKILPMFMNYGMIYIPEIKFEGIVSVNNKMETNIKDIYSVGECSNKATTIMGAMATGLIAGRNILKEM